jgi:DNA primase
MSTRAERVLTALRIEHETKGHRAWARCPFHDDNDPSWTIQINGSRAGLHHCFSCKRGGDLVDLVRHVQTLSRREAEDWLEDLGKKYDPPKVAARVVERDARLGRKRFRLPLEVVIEPFERWPSAARRYAERRGITAAQVDLFGLGYAVDARLAGRLVFPARSGFTARPESYSARSFVDEEPRYLTPHERENADPGAIFGEHLWPAPGHRSVLILTEGSIDALAVVRVTLLPVGALGGSEFAGPQAMRVATFPAVIVLTDPDEAGDKAALKIRAALGRHVQVVRARLPEGMDAAKMDPDELGIFIDRISSHHARGGLGGGASRDSRGGW